MNKTLEESRDKAAQERGDRISARIKPGRVRDLATRALNEPSKAKKIFWLWKMGDTLAEAAKGNTPCDKGCSHCCHIPLLISQDEAEVIAKKTGRKMTLPLLYKMHKETGYSGVPCSMLKNGRCSIYEFRPMTCRVHYSVDNDESACILEPGKPKDVPYINATDYQMTYVRALGIDAKPRYADIRDFFK